MTFRAVGTKLNRHSLLDIEGRMLLVALEFLRKVDHGVDTAGRWPNTQPALIGNINSCGLVKLIFDLYTLQ